MVLDFLRSYFGPPTLDDQTIQDVRSATDRENIGSAFSRAWDTVIDWVCSTNRVEAKKCLFDLHSFETTLMTKAKSFNALKGFVGEQYKQYFHTIETEDETQYRFEAPIKDVARVSICMFKKPVTGGQDIIIASLDNEFFEINDSFNQAFDDASEITGYSTIEIDGDAYIKMEGPMAKNVELKGFHNFNNTCYANSTLKLLIKSLGTDFLMGHLNKLNEAPGTKSFKEGVDKFIALVEAAASGEDGIVKQELDDLFAWMQKQPGFTDINQDGESSTVFKLVGPQQDANEFIMKLLEMFKLDQASEFSIIGKRQHINPANGEVKHGNIAPPSFFLDTVLEDQAAGLQGLLDSALKSEQIEIRWHDDDNENINVSSKLVWAAEDISTLKRLNIHISSVVYDIETGKIKKLYLDSADFDATLKFPVHDEKTGNTFMLTLQAQEVVIHDGETADSGHYYMYSRNSLPDHGWMKHNDSTVTPVDKINEKEQPKMISFAIVAMEGSPVDMAAHESNHLA